MYKHIFFWLGLLFTVSVQAWQPHKTVELIVPFPPGGSTDVIARVIADALTQHENINVRVINLPGAKGVIGTNHVIASRPSEHTLSLLLTGTTFVFNSLLKTPGAGYDIHVGISPIVQIGTVANYLYAKKTIAYTDFRSVVEDLRLGKNLTFGITNAGAEFSARLLAARSGATINIIPYQGSAPAVQDLAGGHIDFLFDSASSNAAIAAEQAGNIIKMATVNPGESDPIAIDNVVKGVVTSSWFGISGPPGIDDNIIEFYNRAVNRVLSRSDVKQRLDAFNVSIVGGTPMMFSNQIAYDYQRYRSIAEFINQ